MFNSGRAYRAWLIGGILWVAATVVFAGIRQEHGMCSIEWVSGATPEQQQRKERIQMIEAVGRILKWGSAAYALIGVIAFFPKRFFATLFAGINIIFATGLIVGWTINCYHLGAVEHGYRRSQLIHDWLFMAIFLAPLWVMLLIELPNAKARKRLFAGVFGAMLVTMILTGQYGLIMAVVILPCALSALFRIATKPAQARTSFTILP